MIDKILKAAASMKKHKSHARHVFTYLEKNHGITIVYNDSNDADSCSKKSDTSTRKSSSTTGVAPGKISNISRTSDFVTGQQRHSIQSNGNGGGPPLFNGNQSQP